MSKVFHTAVLMVAGLLAAVRVCAAVEPPPHRIVSINLCSDELLIALADPDQIVSLSIYATDPVLSFFADKAKAFRHDAGEAETVIDLDPDLVLAGRYTKRASRDMLSALGYRVELLDPARSIGDSIAQIRQVASLVGHPERGERLVEEINAARDRALAAAGGAPRRTAAVYQRRGYVTGGETLTGELLSAVGLTNFGGELAGMTGGIRSPGKARRRPPGFARRLWITGRSRGSG